MALIQTTTTQEFEKTVLQSNKLVLVDFWAQWCMPCRMMEPVLADVAKQLDEGVDIVKVNIEESADNNELARQYQVQSIPNMNIFRDGKMVKQIIGMRSAQALKNELESLL